MRGEDWSKEEVRLTVEDYFDMLRRELRGESFNKTAHRRSLLPHLEGRTDGAVEMKRANISAALSDMGLPFIDGYKPRHNYQDLVLDFVEKIPEDLRDLMDQTLVSMPERSTAIELADVEREVRPPVGGNAGKVEDRSAPRPPIFRFDYAERDAANRRLGLLGEEFVLEIERKRLIRSGRPDLARSVQWTSKEVGDGAGYDIRSFTKDGNDAFIEVKTTNLGRGFPFFITSGEKKMSERLEAQYRLVRVFHFSKDARFYTLRGAVSLTCTLDPELFRARPL